jgi:hypothetical protein
MVKVAWISLESRVDGEGAKLSLIVRVKNER